MAIVYSTCQTPGCINQGVETPLVDPLPTVICGPCGQPITALADSPTPLPEELPEWEL